MSESVNSGPVAPESVAFEIRRGDRPSAEPVGLLLIAPDGQITLFDVDQLYTDALRDIVASINQLETLRIKVPVQSDEPGSITQEEVSRDDPNLTDAIVEFFDQQYGLLLQPA